MEIHLYDFDNTLFRSPYPPESAVDKKGRSKWWGGIASMTPPAVPRKPGNEWWVPSVVKSARKSIADPNVYAILMTGRSNMVFKRRVYELLKQQGLNFDEVKLSPSDSRTEVVKRKRIYDLLLKYPQTQMVKIWDDRDHVATFGTLVKKLGYKVKIHKVVAKPMQAGEAK